MDRGMHKIVIIVRKTRMDELIQRYNTMEQAKFYIEHLGADFNDYVNEDIQYKNAVGFIKDTADKYARTQIVERSFVPGMIFGKDDIVVAVGQDGLVANVMKYLDGQILIGVNPDEKRWDGILLAFDYREIESVIKKVIKGNVNTKYVTIAKAETKDGQYIYGVNDLFIGQKTHISSKYEIEYMGKKENQCSSGIIVSTGMGSTGWVKSIITGINIISSLYGKDIIEYNSMEWGEDKLIFTVREPYLSKFTQTGIIYGEIKKNNDLSIISNMAENGVVFSDGVESDYIEFNAGSQIKISIADKKGKIAVR